MEEQPKTWTISRLHKFVDEEGVEIVFKVTLEEGKLKGIMNNDENYSCHYLPIELTIAEERLRTAEAVGDIKDLKLLDPFTVFLNVNGILEELTDDKKR